MKFIEKISLTLFSIIILITTLLLTLVLFNWIEINNAYYLLQFITSNPVATNISLTISIILIILSALCVFFPSYGKDKNKKTEGLLLENDSGKLLISIDTIENLVKGVVVGFLAVKSTNCKVKLDKQVNNIIIDLNLVVKSETIIKDLSVNIQDKIKETIKRTTEIDVKQINIRIKNIENSND